MLFLKTEVISYLLSILNIFLKIFVRLLHKIKFHVEWTYAQIIVF